jgi:hypothetical protein
MRALALAVLALTLATPALAQPLTTAFTFQGRLDNGGAAGQGNFDLRFRMYDAPFAGNQVGPTLCSDNAPATDGVVSVQLDFGAQFAGLRRWLEVDVRPDTGLNCTNATGFTTLSPRQELTSIPHASYAVSAGIAQVAVSAQSATTATSATTAAIATNATQLNGQAASFYQNAANLTSGTIPPTRLSGSYTNPLTLNNASNAFTGSFSGSGAGLSNVPFSSLTGVPATVSLQNATPGAAQTGNLNLAGEGLFSGIGIGTTSPAVQLHVADPSVARLRVDHTTGAQIVLQAQSSLARIGTANNFPLHFLVGGNDQMTIDTSGRVGIGTTSPDADLHVFRASAGTVTAHANAPLAVENNSNAYINVLAPDANETGLLFGRPGASIPNAAGGIVFNNTANPDGLQFRTGGNFTRMTIDDAGNVGIGTANPSAKLHVVGSSSDVILPTSSITAEEIADEVGIAADIGSSTSLTSGVLRTLATRTISAPRAGYVIAIASVDISRTIQSGSDIIDVCVGTNNTSLTSTQNRRTQLQFDTTFASSTAFPCTFQGVFNINAGSTTFYIIAEGNASPATSAFNPHLSLIFVPTSYGAVDVDNP